MIDLILILACFVGSVVGSCHAYITQRKGWAILFGITTLFFAVAAIGVGGY